MEQIKQMIEETKQWRLFHKANRNWVEAAACDIREVALKQALAAVSATRPEQGGSSV
jgi:hypothetical protein